MKNVEDDPKYLEIEDDEKHDKTIKPCVLRNQRTEKTRIIDCSEMQDETSITYHQQYLLDKIERKVDKEKHTSRQINQRHVKQSLLINPLTSSPFSGQECYDKVRSALT